MHRENSSPCIFLKLNAPYAYSDLKLHRLDKLQYQIWCDKINWNHFQSIFLFVIKMYKSQLSWKGSVTWKHVFRQSLHENLRRSHVTWLKTMFPCLAAWYRVFLIVTHDTISPWSVLSLSKTWLHVMLSLCYVKARV